MYVEVEDAAGIAPCEEDREERDHRQNEEREPEERKHDVVRDREEPLHEPQPAAQTGLKLALDSDRIRRVLSVLVHSVHSYMPPSIGAPTPPVRRQSDRSVLVRHPQFTATTSGNSG